jgi:hypothetical protein
MGKTYRALVEDQQARKHRLPSLCRAGYHSWEALLQPGWFECQRCGVHGVCSHVPVMPRGVVRLSCAESCLRFDWQGYRR